MFSSSLSTISKLMRPPRTPVENEGDWQNAEDEIGTPLPSDYKLFISAYGSGMIGRMPVYVLNPFAGQAHFPLKEMGEGVFRGLRTLMADGYDPGYSLFPEPSGILPCAVTGNGDSIFWHTGKNTEKWHVVIWECGLAEFHAFPDYNLLGFLTDLVSNKFSIFPSVFFNPTPSFLQFTD